MSLKPCPFCGHSSIVPKALEPRMHYCWCHECGAQGPFCETDAEAIEAWNRRADSVSEAAPAQVHAMCAYLLASENGFDCTKCAARTDTPYGPGERGCYGIAEETLLKAGEILRSAATRGGE